MKKKDLGSYGIYYQPNKHNDSDCVIRAYSIAEEITWREAYQKMFEISLRHYYILNSTEGMSSVFEETGYVKHSVKVNKGSRRQTVAEFCETHKEGKYILRVSNHCVAVINGKFYDTWDCSLYKVYTYWEKKN